MANEQNLVSLATRPQRERQEIARKGQVASTKAKKENKLIKDRILERMGENDWDDMIDGLIKRAKEGDKAFEVLRDTIGQKPSDVIEVTGMAEQQSKVDELLDQLHEGRK